MSSSRKKKGKRSGSKRPTRKQTGGFSIKTHWPWLCLIAGVAFLFLWPVIQAEFTELDDKHLILTQGERLMRHPWHIWDSSIFTPHYKPLVLLTWLIERSLFGPSSALLHFNNLLLHAIDSILVFFVVLRLSSCFENAKGRSHMVALFSALLFAVHPLHVESIAWAIERKDVLYTFFFLLGILAYFKYLDKPSAKWILLTALAFAGSVLSKAPAIMFPFILLLIDWAYDRPLKVGRVTEKWPVFLVFAAALVLYGVLDPSGGTTGNQYGDEGNIVRMISEKPVSNVYPLTEFPSFYAKLVLIGLKGIFWYAHSYIPVGLSLAYPYRSWLPAMGHAIHIFPVLLALGAFFVWRKRKTYRLLFFTHAFFFIALAPALVRTGLGKGIFLSDRYVYLALMGLTFFVSTGILSFLDRKQWAVRRQYAVMGALVLLLGVLAFLQARVWKTGYTLWSSVINTYPSIDYAYVNRAIWYKDNNEVNKALSDLNKAIELDHFDEHALIHRGTLLRQTGNNEQALADFNEVLKRRPGNEHAINGKANVLFELGRYKEAEEAYTEGLKTKPYMSTLLANRAAARYYLRKYDEALEDLAKAERISPNYGGIDQKRTVIYMATNDFENAVISARKTAQQDPSNHANYGDLGTALQNLGRHQEAIDAFSQAIRIFNKGKRYYLGRAKSYEAVGNMEAAQKDRQTADSL